MWVFTATKFEGSRPFTVQANYEGFSEGGEFIFLFTGSLILYFIFLCFIRNYKMIPLLYFNLSQ